MTWGIEKNIEYGMFPNVGVNIFHFYFQPYSNICYVPEFCKNPEKLEKLQNIFYFVTTSWKLHIPFCKGWKATSKFSHSQNLYFWYSC